MNYYQHHIGDYQKKTSHLSIMEHGVYMLMLQTYYATEQPLPTGGPLYRIVRAITKAERAAVDSIVKQFWKHSGGGLVNGRALEEIGAYQAFVEEQSRKGKASGAARRRNSGSTPVQPETNSGSSAVATETQPPTPTPTPIPRNTHTDLGFQSRVRQNGKPETDRSVCVDDKKPEKSLAHR